MGPERGCHPLWGRWHGDTLPALRRAMRVEEQACPQPPEGGLAPRRASRATLKEALGALGTQERSPSPGGCRPGLWAVTEGRLQGEQGGQRPARCTLGEEGNELEVVLHVPCPGVTCTNSFMPQKQP